MSKATQQFTHAATFIEGQRGQVPGYLLTQYPTDRPSDYEHKGFIPAAATTTSVYEVRPKLTGEDAQRAKRISTALSNWQNHGKLPSPSLLAS